ncbi:PRMT5 arginine-N-methyltransferase domain-containing protein [Ditylenchus destructor]|nr:PRMT5 arginine-N-methyltransferase domain-containing protein [Ditylenchus destructor]
MKKNLCIGWFFPCEQNVQDGTFASTSDINIATHCKNIVSKGIDFLCYPIGGCQRYFWRPQKEEEPPQINLPDQQLQSRSWQTYVNSCISSWIDCDSDDDEISRLSIVGLEKELNYLSYMGLQSVVIPLKHVKSPKLGSIIHKWLWSKASNFTFWIILPTNLSCFRGNACDVWSIWADFRNMCENHPRLMAGIKICEDSDEEFYTTALLNRWRNEPVACLWIDSAIFVSGSASNDLRLSQFHCQLLRDIWLDICPSLRPRYVLLSSLSNDNGINLASDYADAVKATFSDSTELGRNLVRKWPIELVDSLQTPLQPLSANLESIVYNTFEEDKVKYAAYKTAISLALKDIIDRKSAENNISSEVSIVAFVVGAGRGPLVNMLIDSENEVKNCYSVSFILNIWAVEKNPNACLSLQYCNEQRWNNRVHILHCDMRNLAELNTQSKIPNADIIISELLGSFADNELSPECLDGISMIVDDNTLFIPQSYKSYLAPAQSIRMHQNVIKMGTEKDYWSEKVPGTGREPCSSPITGDSLYVACLSDSCLLDEPKECFAFCHPNTESNAREKHLRFTFAYPCELMGFAGYFDVCLYKNISLSTVPKDHTSGLISWFPALLPLRNLIRLSEESTISLFISRKIDEGGIWYEWCIEYEEPNTGNKIKTPLQNKNGETQYMRLKSE